MSRSAKIDAAFGDGRHCFRLALAELEELQEKCDAGPPLILARIEASQWKTADVRETIRLGLIGGGMDALKALALVERYVDERPDWTKNALLARGVLYAALVGVDEEPPEKPKGEAETASPDSPTENGAGLPSGDQPPPSDSPRQKK